MPRNLSRKRRERREAEEKARKDPNSRFYTGYKCSCGKPLFIFLFSRDKSDIIKLHWPFLIPDGWASYTQYYAHTEEEVRTGSDNAISKHGGPGIICPENSTGDVTHDPVQC